ncbi:Two-component response regulator [gamma proteobacterium HdN1]|nr:Two-component response regulator [gamma proteobacterium HdN1]
MEDVDVLLIDDNSSFRESIALYLECAGMRVRTFESGEHFIGSLREIFVEHCGEQQVNRICIVTDMRMPRMNGLELMDVLYRHHIKAPVIMITGHGDIPLTVQAMQRGAASVLEKPFEPEALVATISSAISSPGVLLRNPDEARAKLGRLTPREAQIMNLVCIGHLSKTIADKLGISVKTVEMHRANLTAKLGIRSVQELVRLNLGYE